MPAGETTFHLVRHGDYGLLGRVLAGRTQGHGLSAAGIAQAESLAGLLGKLPIAAVVSSPLQRTRETAGPIAAGLGLPVEIDDDVNEIDFGRWSGLAFQELDGEPAWAEFNKCRSLGCPPGGETMAAAQTRAAAALVRWRQRFPDQHIVIVSHADVIKAVLCLVLGISMELMRRIDIAPGSRSVVALSADDARVELVNQPLPG